MCARLAAALEATDWVDAALLFGSHATERARPDSDVDLAIVVTTPDVSLRDELELQSQLEAIARTSVDLVRFDRASSLLKGELGRDGVVLFERRPGLGARARAEAMIEWLDFEPAYRRARDLYLKRLARGA